MSERRIIESIPNDYEKRERLARLLRSDGIENEEVRKMLEEWTIKQERKVELAGRTPEAQIEFEIERAKLYAEGDYKEEALDILYDALDIAKNENKPEIEQKIREEIAAI